jgi:23S rRNA pseudouridine1911/1915/1917 synthase
MENIEILFEDNHLLAVNKPFGMPSQGDETGDLCVSDWAKEFLREKYGKLGNVYVGLLHRLDRPTGGVLLLAKTSKAAARLSEDFQAHKIQKTYLAITENIPDVPEGELFHYLAKLPGKNIVKAYREPAFGAKPAKLRYRIADTHHKNALLEVSPLTGRQHQIRVQLAAMGCVICGDVKYGKTEFLPNKCIALLAHTLTIQHPVTKSPLTITAPKPTDGIWAKF